MKHTIDQEFQDLVVPLTTEELQRLHASLEAEGCRDALVVWTPEAGDGVPILLDGHHRYAWCLSHGAPFKRVEAVGIQRREDAKIWIIRNQLGRRNLADYERAELVLQMGPLIAARAKAREATHTGDGYQKSDSPVHTLKELGKLAGVSHDTIHKAKVIAQEADEPTKTALRQGERSIHSVYQALRPPKGRPSSSVKGEGSTAHPPLVPLSAGVTPAVIVDQHALAA